MAKAKTDPVREDRIQNEAIVDAYGPEEQAMGWYYYLQDRINFPFQARCVASMLTSPIRKGETLEVLGMAPEEACDADMLIQIQWHGRRMDRIAQTNRASAKDRTSVRLGPLGFEVVLRCRK